MKIRISNTEALNQALQAANAQQLAQQILARMRTGIVVLDKDNNINLFNQAAAKLLAFNKDVAPQLSQIPALASKVSHWQRTQENLSPLLRDIGHNNDELKV